MAIETAVLQNINQAYETFKKRCKDFNPTKTNREAITQHIAQSGLAHARWTVDIFWDAFETLSAQGLLERFPTDEDIRKQKEYRMYREANDSTRLKSHSEKTETKGEEILRLYREWVARCRANEASATTAEQAAAIKAKQGADVSHLPTMEQILEGAELTAPEMKALSSQQLREYMRRSQQAQLEKYRRQREGKQ